jgi:hypothetical protein
MPQINPVVTDPLNIYFHVIIASGASNFAHSDHASNQSLLSSIPVSQICWSNYRLTSALLP